MSAFTVATKFDGSSSASRLKVLKPCREKVTVYRPGRRSTMVYLPSPSVDTVLVFSISASLATSTVTPGSTAPDVSFTVPPIALWARARVGSATTHTSAANALRKNRHFVIDVLLRSRECCGIETKRRHCKEASSKYVVKSGADGRPPRKGLQRYGSLNAISSPVYD